MKVSGHLWSTHLSGPQPGIGFHDPDPNSPRLDFRCAASICFTRSFQEAEVGIMESFVLIR
jgi:hypothetical protein